jgi:hypothetical protein
VTFALRRAPRVSPARPRLPPRCPLRSVWSTVLDAFHRASTRLRFPSSECRACSLVGESTLHAHRFHLEAAAACVSTSCGVLLGQRLDVRPALRPAERRDARCVGPVSANSLLRTSTRASSVPCCVGALARAAQPERSPAPRQSDSLRRATRCPDVFHRDGRCLPVVVRADRASDTPVASPGDPVTLARSRGLPRAAETAADPLA